MGDAGKSHFIGRFAHVVLFDSVVILALGQIVNFFKMISSVANEMTADTVAKLYPFNLYRSFYFYDQSNHQAVTLGHQRDG